MRTRSIFLLLATTFVGAPVRADVPAAVPLDASSKAACTVHVIHARADGDGSMDGQLSGLVEEFKKPPFTAWKTFKLLDKTSASLSVGGSASFATPTGRAGTLSYSGPGQKGDKPNLRLAIEVPGEKSSTRSQVTLDEGGHILMAGIKHQGGILIYAVSCKSER